MSVSTRSTLAARAARRSAVALPAAPGALDSCAEHRVPGPEHRAGGRDPHAVGSAGADRGSGGRVQEEHCLLPLLELTRRRLNLPLVCLRDDLNTEFFVEA